MVKKAFSGILLSIVMVLFFLAMPNLSAQPPPPCVFYGYVYVGGNPAPDGLNITAMISGTMLSWTQQTKNGTYGWPAMGSNPLTIPSANASASEKDGGATGDIVEFYVNGTKTDQTATFEPGVANRLDLSVSLSPAPGTIYIRADGSVEGTTSIQTADNATYVFTADINASLVVERNNIIIDGNGYTLQGTGEYLSKGIDLSGRTNVTAHNATIKAFNYGIWLNGSSDNTVSGNNITANTGFGVRLDSSSGNTLSGNNFAANGADAIVLDHSSDNTLSGNNVTANSGAGIYLSGSYLDYSYNNTLSGNNVTANSGAGIYLSGSAGNTLSGNNVANNGFGYGGVVTNGRGIYLYSSFDNVLSDNNVTNNCYGIWLYSSYNNTLLGNNVTANNYLGINLGTSPGNTLSGNVMGGNGRNFGVYADALYGNVLSQYLQSVDASNLVDGKPVYYFVNQSDLVVNANAYPEVGYLAFVNCVNVTAQALNLTSNGQGLLLAFTNDSKITGNNVANNDVGIYSYISFDTVLSGNDITANSGGGIYLSWSNNNALFGNNVTANDALGIWLDYSSNNTFSGNNFTANNGTGILISYYSNYNVLSGNNVANNEGGIGFYLSDYNTLSGNNVTANSGDGIGLSSSDYNTLSGNNVANNWIGIELGHEIDLQFISNPSDHNVLSGNNVTANNKDGIVLYYSLNNTLFGNNVTANNGNGIRLYYSSGNTLSSNVMRSNQYNFGVGGNYLGDYLQSVDASNLVDGKPVYYFVNQSDLVVNANAYPEVGYLAFVNCVNVTAQALNLTSNGQGLLLAFTNDSKITGNNVANNDVGIVLDHSSGNTLSGSNVTANSGAGIYLFTSSGNALSDDNIANNNNCGVVLDLSSNLNSISGNNMTADNWGIWLRTFSNNNTIFGNNITANNGVGIYLASSSNNTIYHNNFADNNQQVSSGASMNVWDDGYPSGGNIWSDYTGVDLKRGYYQNMTGSDGIGDTPYVIDVDNLDRFPLMFRINTFDVGIWNETTCNVDVATNSTLSNFQVNITQQMISFNVTGTEGTSGFCRITIPNIIVQEMWQGNYTVLINGEPWPSFTSLTDTTNTYISISYTHSEHQIAIIPEFPSAATLPLLMSLSLLAMVFAKKRHIQKT